MSAALQNSRNRNRSRQQPVSGRWEVVVMYRYWLNLALGWSLLIFGRNITNLGLIPTSLYVLCWILTCYILISLKMWSFHTNRVHCTGFWTWRQFQYQLCTMDWFLSLEKVSVLIVHTPLISEHGESFSICRAHYTGFWAWRKFQH